MTDKMKISCLSNTYNQRREEKVSPARKFYQNGVDFVQPQAAKPAGMVVALSKFQLCCILFYYKYALLYWDEMIFV
uniref:Uncharacterized protein n=1 Tax=Cannabis sativa TaxID=3483 RepID=A0A803R806_CANSA